MRKVLVWLAILVGLAAILGSAIYFMSVPWRHAGWDAGRRVLIHPTFGEFAAAIAGAFFGSISAFYLGVRQQRRDRRDRQHEALLSAQYAIASQWNVVEHIQRDFLRPLRMDKLRHTKLPLYVPGATASFAPLVDLIFIAKTDDPNLLQEIRVAEDCFRSCVELLAERNQRKERLDNDPTVVIRDFDPQTGRAVIEAEPRKLFMIEKITDAIYARCDLAESQLSAVFVALEKCIKRSFPKLRALRLVPEDIQPRTAPDL